MHLAPRRAPYCSPCARDYTTSHTHTLHHIMHRRTRCNFLRTISSCISFCMYIYIFMYRHRRATSHAPSHPVTRVRASMVCVIHMHTHTINHQYIIPMCLLCFVCNNIQIQSILYHLLSPLAMLRAHASTPTRRTADRTGRPSRPITLSHICMFCRLFMIHTLDENCCMNCSHMLMNASVMQWNDCPRFASCGELRYAATLCDRHTPTTMHITLAYPIQSYTVIILMHNDTCQ